MKNEFVTKGGDRFRVLGKRRDKWFLIRCTHDRIALPFWDFPAAYEKTDFSPVFPDAITESERAVMTRRKSEIAEILPVVQDPVLRKIRISLASELFGVSRDTIRRHLCLYLMSGDDRSLLPAKRQIKAPADTQKVMRRAINKYYYSTDKVSLKVVYLRMIEESFQKDGRTLPNAPSYGSFFPTTTAAGAASIPVSPVKGSRSSRGITEYLPGMACRRSRKESGRR